jgi:hypothetical protein
VALAIGTKPAQTAVEEMTHREDRSAENYERQLKFILEPNPAREYERQSR